MRNSTLFAACSVLILAAATAASAGTADAPAAAAPNQAAPAPTPPNESSGSASPAADTGVGELVVTAERRSTRLQTTAVAASVLTGADLQKKNIVDVDDLQFTTPSLSIQNFGQGNEFNIRGIGKSESNIQTPSGSVTYRDGVPVFGGFFQDEPFYDIASIEVLRGPQGTFAGQNATGGAIFIREVDPSLTAGYSGFGQVQAGNYDDFRAQGAVNLPISSTLAARIAFNAENRNSFFHVTGPYTGNPGKLHELNGRLSVLWQPTTNFEVLGKLDLNYISQGGYPAGPAVGPYSTRSDPFRVTSDAHLMGIDSFLRGVVRASYTFDNGITFNSISGYQTGRTAQAIDLDGTDQAVPVPPPAAPAIFTPETFTDHATETVYSQEFNLVSPSDRRLTWVLGGFYTHDTTIIPPGGFDAGTPPGVIDLETVNRSVKNSTAGFGQVSYAITPALQLQVGARYTTSNFNQSGTVTLAFGGFPLIVLDAAGHQADSKVTGKVALNWTVNPDNFLYAFVASGHKAGGVNGAGSLTLGTLPPDFAPEDVVDYEVGWKSTLLDGHLRTQLGAFYDDYKRFQVDFLDPLTEQNQIKNVVGTTHTGGIEAQAQAVFGAFSFDVNASWLHTRLGTLDAVDSRFNSSTPACDGATGPVTGPCIALEGGNLPNAPEWTFNAGAQYAFRVGDHATLTPRLDYAYLSGQWATLFESPVLDRLNPRNLLKAQLNYETGDWQVTLYGTNITDDVYITSTNHALTYAGPPRQYGIRVTRRF